jgi:hypothetical protein
MPVKLTYSLLLLLTLGLVTSAALVRRKYASAPKPQTLNTTPNMPVRGPVQVVRFSLYDIGIYPQEAQAKQGMVTISIEDLSGNSSGLIVERVDTASHVAAGRVSKETNRLRSRSELFLPEGRYEVADATRRNNRALLIVGP